MALRHSSQRAGHSIAAAAAAGRGLARGTDTGRRCCTVDRRNNSAASLVRPLVQRELGSSATSDAGADGRSGRSAVWSQGTNQQQTQWGLFGQQYRLDKNKHPLQAMAALGGVGTRRRFATNIEELGKGWEESPGVFIRGGGEDGLDGDPGPPPPIDKSVVTEPTQNVRDVLTALDSLNFIELAMLIELMKDQLGLDEVPTLNLPGHGGGGDGGADAGAPKAEGKTVFNVSVTGFGEKAKIKVIKEIRSLTGLGLREAKEMVEGLPKVVKADVNKEEGEKIVELLEKAGATAELV